MRNLFLIPIVLAVSGCFGFGSINSQPPCIGPVALPDRALNDQQTEIYWGRDRAHLVQCYWRNEVASGRKGPKQ